MRSSSVNSYVDKIHSKPDYIIPFERTQTRIESEAFRARRAQFSKIYLELGSGSGGHLIGQARRDPTALFVGVELRFKRVYRTAEKAEQEGLKNLCVLKTDARRVEELFEPQSITGVYINFPDPWAKRRWRKHRLLTEELLDCIFKLLVPGGFLSFKSDHQEYFAEACQTVRADQRFTIESETSDLYRSDLLTDNVASEFEQLFRVKGVAIGKLVARKKA